MTLKTRVGDVSVPALYGKDRKTGKRIMPLRKRLGLQDHQLMSPALQDLLCFLAISCASYARAAEVAQKYGIPVDAGQIQRLAQQAGKRAEAQTARRVSAAFDLRKGREISRRAEQERNGERFNMVLMLDGTMLRNRGKDWGLDPPEAPGERSVWHELKAGLVIRLPVSQAAGRLRHAKYYVADAGDPEAVGRKLYAEALRRGLEQAERVYVIADGAVWIWRLAEEHFPESAGVLDFYHASQHLWALGRVLHGSDEEKVSAWVKPLLSKMKHCGGGGLLPVLEGLLKAVPEGMGAERRKELNREVAYFRGHGSRLDYPGAKGAGIPLGSGSMESACSQIQRRFKCTGQFWLPSGERYLLALELAWRNRDWNELWTREAA